jgi:hypothetical protein
MKKQYINPNTIIVELEMQQMIADSTKGFNPTPVNPESSDAKNFDFFAAPEVEEETPNKNKLNQEEEWDEFEEEE